MDSPPNKAVGDLHGFKRQNTQIVAVDMNDRIVTLRVKANAQGRVHQRRFFPQCRIDDHIALKGIVTVAGRVWRTREQQQGSEQWPERMREFVQC